jgi:hypothetical protein
VNLLADEGVDRQIVALLRQDGHKVLYIGFAKSENVDQARAEPGLLMRGRVSCLSRLRAGRRRCRFGFSWLTHGVSSAAIFPDSWQKPHMVYEDLTVCET